jgi:hypothetical protein
VEFTGDLNEDVEALEALSDKDSVAGRVHFTGDLNEDVEALEASHLLL